MLSEQVLRSCPWCFGGPALKDAPCVHVRGAPRHEGATWLSASVPLQSSEFSRDFSFLELPSAPEGIPPF